MHTRGLQAIGPVRSDRIGILHRRHDASDPRVLQRLRTRRRPAMMIARLERDVRSRTAYVMPQSSRALQGADFGMRFPGALVPAFAQYGFPARDHTPDTRVRCGREQSPPCKIE